MPTAVQSGSWCVPAAMMTRKAASRFSSPWSFIKNFNHTVRPAAITVAGDLVSKARSEIVAIKETAGVGSADGRLPYTTLYIVGTRKEAECLAGLVCDDAADRSRDLLGQKKSVCLLRGDVRSFFVDLPRRIAKIHLEMLFTLVISTNSHPTHCDRDITTCSASDNESSASRGPSNFPPP